MNRTIRGVQGPWSMVHGLGGKLLAVLALSLFLPADAARAEDIRAGTAKAAFELPAGTPLAGYSKRHGRPNQGTHDPVGVRALALRGSGGAVVILSCDLLIIDEDLARSVGEQSRALGLAPDFQLLIAATHTHSGPGAYGNRFAEKISMGHFDPAVAAVVSRTIAETAVRAAESLQPVQASYRSGRAEGLVKNRVDIQGPVDDELSVAAFYPIGSLTAHPSGFLDAPQETRYVSAEKPVAILVNFAAHPTTLGAWNRQLSADYPGVVSRELERRFPTAVCLFLAGAVGDQAPIKEGDGFARAERIGAPLADRAADLLADAKPVAVETLGVSRLTRKLDKPEVRIGKVRLWDWLSRSLVDDDATLTVVTVGRLVLAGVPCDLAAGLGNQIRAAARRLDRDPMVVGFADDYIGYCMPRRSYEAKSYESSMAFNGPDTGDAVTNDAIRMIEETADRHAPRP